MDEFEKVDREKKDPKAKPIFSALKKLQHLVFNPDKYDPDEYYSEYRRLDIDLNDRIYLYFKTKDHNHEYGRIGDKIKKLLSTINEYNGRELYKK